jgi:hypothetical protein
MPETTIMTSYFCTRKQACIATVYGCTPIPPIGSDLLINRKPYRLVEVSQQVRTDKFPCCETFLRVDPLFPA